MHKKYSKGLGLSTLELGFTLVTFLIVVAVIAFIVGGIVLIVNPQQIMRLQRDEQRKSDLVLIQKALEQYYQEKGAYPPNPPTQNDYRIYNEIDVNNIGSVDWGGRWAPYIYIVPKDPSIYTYVYVTAVDKQKYSLYAHLENPNDKGLCNLGKECAHAPFQACGDICNYGITSSNTSP